MTATKPDVKPPSAGGPTQMPSDQFFRGRRDEAFAFYREALGAEMTMRMLFRDSPEQREAGQRQRRGGDKEMHASFRLGDRAVGKSESDGRIRRKTRAPEVQDRPLALSLSLTVTNEDDAGRLFAALADGGEVHMPLGRTFFASRFGIVADRFGVCWIITATS